MPNLIQLTQIVQNNILPNIFDLKIIVMKRNWVQVIISTCIHRFGQCKQRIELLPKALLILQSQLLAIDPNFWIMIDYNDFVQRSKLYVPIIDKFLQINHQNMVEKSFQIIRNTDDSDGTDDNKRDNDLLSNKQFMTLIENAFYKEYQAWQWPVFNSDYFVVTPENTAFLDAKFV